MRILSKIAKMRKLIDIGANLTDSMYRGEYHGSKKHAEDFGDVLQRCWDGGMQKIIITGGSYTDCEEALKLSQSDERLYSTIGCHPTRCNEFKEDPKEYLNKLISLKPVDKKVVAIGECGLDYDRLRFCEKETQKTYFNYQLQLCELWKLPLFLHCRAAWDDFYQILQDNESSLHGGVVHSFDGSLENMEKAIEMGFYIGINGCSLKTQDNLDVVSKIPVERLLVETDCPWCEIRPTHASYKYIKTHYTSVKKEKFSKGVMIKGRNEPLNIIQVLEVIAGIRDEEPEALCDQVYENTKTLFFPNDL